MAAQALLQCIGVKNIAALGGELGMRRQRRGIPDDRRDGDVGARQGLGQDRRADKAGGAEEGYLVLHDGAFASVAGSDPPL